MTVRLFHRDLGGEGKPPLVVLHGMLGSSRNWITAGKDLSARVHVLAPDLRNHGNSPHVPEMTYEAMAADVLAWLDAQGLGSVSLLGHSMGGKVGMLLACRHPSRIERLILVDIAPKVYYWVGRRGEFVAMNELDLEHLPSRTEAEMRLEGRIPDRAMRRFLASSLDRLPEGGWKWQFNLSAMTRSLLEMEKNPLVPGDRYEGPVLLISGGRSSYVLPADRDAVLAAFPSAQFAVIADSGHNPHTDAREVFVRTVFERLP